MKLVSNIQTYCLAMNFTKNFDSKMRLTKISVNVLIGQPPKITVQYSSNFCFNIFKK